MHTLDDQSPELDRLRHAYLDTTEELLKLIGLAPTTVQLTAGQSLFELPARHNKIFVPREPGLSLVQSGRTLFFYEPGEIIGLDEFLARASAEIRSDFAVSLDQFDAATFLNQIHSMHSTSSLWHQVQSYRFQLMTTLFSGLAKDPSSYSPELRHFRAGQEIIRQGEIAPDVLNMVEGHADVFVDKVKVGEIFPDEIFGALAALTDTPRTATVVARDNAIVLSLPKEKFVELIESRPHTALKMVVDMARSVVELNKRVVGLSYHKG